MGLLNGTSILTCRATGKFAVQLENNLSGLARCGAQSEPIAMALDFLDLEDGGSGEILPNPHEY
jgi:hypothetical protein